MTNIRQEKNKCPRCGKEFTCSKSGKCWCYEVDISPETREELSDKYDTCLCRECLVEFVRSSA